MEDANAHRLFDVPGIRKHIIHRKLLKALEPWYSKLPQHSTIRENSPSFSLRVEFRLHYREIRLEA